MSAEAWIAIATAVIGALGVVAFWGARVLWYAATAVTELRTSNERSSERLQKHDEELTLHRSELTTHRADIGTLKDWAREKDGHFGRGS